MPTIEKSDQTESVNTVFNKASPKIRPKPIAKVKAGIPNLDEILHGGFPEKRTTLIKGAAGTGKTVLGLEVLYHSAMNGEPVIFVSFEETAEAVRQNALAIGWDIPALEEAGLFFLWEAKIDYRTITSGAFGIDPLLAVIKGQAEQLGARRIMVDGVDVLMRIFQEPARERNELYRLHDWLVDQQFTTLMTTKIINQASSDHTYEFLDYMADCVLLLDLRVVSQVTTRRLRVLKYRGSNFYSNEYPYIITGEGNIILPISEVELTHQPPNQKISSGNPDLDKALGDGFSRASCIVISGPSGIGKTTLAATFTHQACAQGKTVLFISFEESQGAIITTMRSPGIDLQPAIDAGRLTFHTVMPEAMGPEEHLFQILQHIEQQQPSCIVVDAISACKRMGSEGTAFDFLIRLINTCKQQHITCLMTNQVTKNEIQLNSTVVGISSIIDSLISIRFVEVDNQIQRDLVIVKSRGAHHSSRHHRLVISDDGIDLAPFGETMGGG